MLYGRFIILSFRKRLNQNRCKSTTCGGFDFIHIQNYIQEFQHRMSAPAQAVLHPICRGTIMIRMVGTMSTYSLNTEAELTVNAARASKPGSVSTELKLIGKPHRAKGRGQKKKSP